MRGPTGDEGPFLKIKGKIFKAKFGLLMNELCKLPAKPKNRNMIITSINT